MDEAFDDIHLEGVAGQYASNPDVTRALNSANVFFPPPPIPNGPVTIPAPSVGSLETVGHASVTEPTPIIDSSGADTAGIGSTWTGPSSCSSHHESVFDHDGRTVSSATDLGDPGENHHGQHVHHINNTVVVQQAIHEDRPALLGLDSALPCELRGHAGCNHVFPLWNQEEWYKHLIEHHFDGVFPPRWGCVFCDEVFVPGSERLGDKISKLRERMAHIKGHYLSGRSLPANIRPDPHVFQHLVGLRKLSPDEYRRLYNLMMVMRPDENLSYSTVTTVVVPRPSPAVSGPVEMVVAGKDRRRRDRPERVKMVHR